MPAPGTRNLLLLGGGPKYLFRDEFDGDYLDLSKWTPTDTYQTTELLVNGGFETVTAHGPPANFQTWTETVGDGQLEDETVVVHAGAHALKETAGPTANTDTIQSFTVIPGLSYRLSFWTRGDGSNAGRYYIWDQTNSVAIQSTISTGVSGVVYTEVAQTFVAPIGCVQVQLHFRCPSVNGGVSYYDDMSVLPTQGLLSVRGGNLVFAGGKAVSVWGDPRLRGPQIVRVAGLTIEWETIPDLLNQYLVGWGTSTTPSLTSSVSIDFENLGILKVRSYDGESINLYLPYVATASFQRVRIILNNPGAFWYLSNDSGATWNLLWVSYVGSASLYPLITTYNAPSLSSYVRVSQGTVPSPVVAPFTAANVPSTGLELLADHGMEGTYTAGLAAGWSKGASSPTVAQSADVYGGSKAQQFVANAQNDQIYSPVTTNPLGSWVISSGWVKRIAGSGGTVRLKIYQVVNNNCTSPYVTNASYQQLFVTSRQLSTTYQLYLQDVGTSSFDTVVLDDVSSKSFTLSSLCDLRPDSAINGVFDGQHTDQQTIGSFQGGIGHWDSATPNTSSSGWIAYYDRSAGRAYLDKCVDGTWTNVLAVTVGYAAGATIRVVRNGTSFALYYGTTLVQLGSTSTISDAQLQTLTHFGAFRTNTSVTVAGVQHYA